MLPKNESLVTDISSLQNPDWCKWLDPKVTFKLTYILQIMAGLITDQTWSDKFIASGKKKKKNGG